MSAGNGSRALLAFMLSDIASTRRLEGESFHQLRLNLLDLQESLPLMPQEVVHFFVQMADL